ncbi:MULTISPECIES: hypothetical protein [unclassified Pseudoalteromonas]|uniref:hypothetical protein n=1 Tax=unclassified Pseudoalteromonas TaxID=194690 RepID=UPI0025B2E5CC|nr:MULTISPECIES: hypothetical protein [unclassified Pseudoalteromonas]MDN3378582.1 hypothetical protein [Pseudoalteromonas sp. APC 3893]MDN3387006.1 hypothetical protein [Pseudoalteromonas sp. APC 4017]
MKYAVLAGALSLFSITAAANETSLLSYDYVEAGYAKMDVDDIDELSFDGYVVKLSKQVSDNWYLTGLYASTSDDLFESESMDYRDLYQNGDYVGTSTLYTESGLDIEITRLELGLGYIQQLSAVTNLDYSIKLGRLKFESDNTYLFEERFNGAVFDSYSDGDSESNSADILSANVKLRHLLTEQFEINAGIGYERLHDDESENNLVLQAGFNFALTEKAILGASYRYVDEYADIAATLRYYF